jgi:2-polyprenyl-3-methyl-5-hydroxy-6-metoxy-1,4-benzoquinol methylase
MLTEWESQSRKACPLCESTDKPQSWKFGLLRCSRCLMIFDEAIWNEYSNHELNGKFFEGESSDRSDRWTTYFEKMNNARTLASLKAFELRKSSRLLEIGVGSGSLLNAAREVGFSVKGCDLSSAVCRRVSEQHSIEMHCGTLASLPTVEQFDVIIVNHVLEHMNEPVTFLTTVKERLAPRGIVRIAVPNVASWDANLKGWNSYEPYHLLYFTPCTGRELLERAGLRIIKSSTHESFSGWYLAILRTVLGHTTAVVRSRHKQLNERRLCVGSALELGHRLAMVTFGVVTLPLRLIQARLKKGDEIVFLASNEVK